MSTPRLVGSATILRGLAEFHWDGVWWDADLQQPTLLAMEGRYLQFALPLDLDHKNYFPDAILIL